MTPKQVIPRSKANADIEQALDYYHREAGAAVALDLVEALEEAYRHISHYPASGSPRYAVELNLAGLRFWPLQRYPYLIFYAESDAFIDVWRVLHEQRDIPASLRPSPAAT